MRSSIATVSMLSPAKAESQLRVVSATVRRGELGRQNSRPPTRDNGIAIGGGLKLMSRNVKLFGSGKQTTGEDRAHQKPWLHSIKSDRPAECYLCGPVEILVVADNVLYLSSVAKPLWHKGFLYTVRLAYSVIEPHQVISRLGTNSDT
jgi:hypothetical protein